MDKRDNTDLERDKPEVPDQQKVLKVFYYDNKFLDECDKFMDLRDLNLTKQEINLANQIIANDERQKKARELELNTLEAKIDKLRDAVLDITVNEQPRQVIDFNFNFTIDKKRHPWHPTKGSDKRNDE